MSRPMIGHVLHRPNHAEGVRGLDYDYVFAANGVFLEAQNQFIKARIRLVDTEIRGLAPLTERVELVNGLVPAYLLAMALRRMRQDTSREVYVAIIWQGQMYELRQPHQEASAARVSYDPLPNTVLDLHSHGSMSAHFSATDDRDDQGFRISAVIGKLDQREAEVSLRLGVYGYHARISVPEVFSGEMPTDLTMAQTP